MSPLMYECINCHSRWGNLEAGEDNISHGLCRRCVRELQKEKVRKKQQKEGFSPCYADGHEDCTEYGCYFYKVCLEWKVSEWEQREGVKYVKSVGQGRR